MRVVVDCANGAAYEMAPEVLRRLGATVHGINAEPDGTNINAGCGALHPEVVAREVVRLGADAGVSHDGDADRALFADADGRVLDGDHVLAALALVRLAAGSLKGEAVVTTPMANLGFLNAMRDAGIEVVTADVGDRYVLEEMERRGLVLGGEQSGHVIVRDLSTTGDGLLTAVLVLSLAATTGGGLKELGDRIRKYPQVLVNVEVTDREALAQRSEIWEAVEAVERLLGGDGRVLVRASGTEQLVRVMVEAPTQEQAEGCAGEVASVVRRTMGGSG
jgi:phosphoglucosamine mutase